MSFKEIFNDLFGDIYLDSDGELNVWAFVSSFIMWLIAGAAIGCLYQHSL